MVERFGWTLIDQPAKSLFACGGEWDNYLKQAASPYNTSLHSSTNYTPYYLTHGQEAQFPVDVLVPSMVCSDFPSSHVAFSVRDRSHNLAPRLKRNKSCTMTEWPVTHHMRKEIWCGFIIPQRTVWNLLLTGRNHTRSWLCQTLKENLGSHMLYHITCPLDSDGQGQIVHYNRLKPYMLPLLPGS